MTIPTYDISMLPPVDMEIDVVGTSIEGGRAIDGSTQAIDFSAGGLWSVRYSNIPVRTAAQHRYWNSLRAWLNGSTRSIILPIVADRIAPFPVGGGSIVAEIDGAHDLNAGTVDLLMTAGSILAGGEMFSIEHPTMGHRAYTISLIDTYTPGDADGNGAQYTVAISPPLREATDDETPLEFRRPKFLARLRAGETMAWLPSTLGTVTRQSVGFIEHFDRLSA